MNAKTLTIIALAAVALFSIPPTATPARSRARIRLGTPSPGPKTRHARFWNIKLVNTDDARLFSSAAHATFNFLNTHKDSTRGTIFLIVYDQRGNKLACGNDTCYMDAHEAGSGKIRLGFVDLAQVRYYSAWARTDAM